MSDDEQLFSKLFARVRVAFNSLSDDHLPLVNLTGLQQNKDEQFTERINSVPVWGALGLFARPKPPATPGNGSEAANGFGVRLGDVVFPIAMIDKRIARAIGALPDWAIALGGYLGQKIVLDSQGDAGNILIQHGTQVIKLDRDSGVLTITVSGLGSPAPVATIQIDDGGVRITGVTSVTETPGGEAGALPVLIAPSLTTITQAIAAVNALGAYVNTIAPGTVPNVPITSNIAVSTALKATP